MTARAEYTAEEWSLLRRTPFAAGMAVVFADGSGVLETARESIALVVNQAGGLQRYPDNELVRSLLSDRSPDPAQSAEREDLTAIEPAKVAEHLRTTAVDMCTRAVALLEDRSREVERDGYLHWVMDAARATALAARNGGWFSRGPLVDEQEKAVLAEIATALGTDVGELPAEGAPVGTGPDDSIDPE